ncbi:short-chain dehydrogenase [Aerococcus urinaehominis]|uniref:Short-chain dehydrogenase n=1 Tax=Aerococcus urinaehominis TaxID=128944 RepID=A0A0X8FLW8_9LACT|nr:SDR family NAD(P)-dependent oxidoreductase [Aerococcus urinaehominis]AMB99737.1 short-chain dehydrogenase [Aerococcus urinaehominis]SDM10899.1 meso-butanediol dehydrogenase / (S,S)-butanediol dehydrogenase / diacetyl reductase [Aerococcus urinaehominis]
MLLTGKVAIITGAGSGFGKASADRFGQEGAKLVLVDINQADLDATVAEFEGKGYDVFGIVADVSVEANVQAFIEDAVAHFGQLDIIFNNAGIYHYGNAEQLPTEQWQQAVAINQTAIFWAAKYAMPHLKKSQGTMINTASAGGLIGFPDAIAYAATKGAVVSMTRALAVDYAKDKVRVNAICPGTGVTGMTSELLEDDQVAEGFLAPIPLKRFGQPEDVANAALFLASDQSSYITGHCLPVDGGWTMS